MIQVIVPEQNKQHWRAAANELCHESLLKPFDALLINFAARISTEILLDNKFRHYPELIAVAHWLRKSHLLELEKLFLAQQQQNLWLPRGMVLHFAPANVDTLFIYSWIIALLLGNSNVIRLSTRSNDQIELLLGVVNKILAEEKFYAIAKRILILRYPHDNQVTEELSAQCAIRIIWGGDEAVKNIRRIPIAAAATELVFANRFSMAALRASSVLQASDQTFQQLIYNFYNDAFWFNQLACSSPRLVLWIGEASEIVQAKARFWQALHNYCQQRQAPIDPAVSMRRLNTAFHYAALDYVNAAQIRQLNQTYLTRLPIKQLTAEVRELHMGASLFLELEANNLTELSGNFTAKDQTLSTYGFTKEELYDFITMLPHRAIDRVVAIGQALNFQTTWDGYNLFQGLTREVGFAI